MSLLLLLGRSERLAAGVYADLPDPATQGAPPSAWQRRANGTPVPKPAKTVAIVQWGGGAVGRAGSVTTVEARSPWVAPRGAPQRPKAVALYSLPTLLGPIADRARQAARATVADRGSPANDVAAAGSATISAECGTVAVSGAAATLTVQRSVAAAVGTFSAVGAPATLVATKGLIASPGAVALSGSAVTLTVQRRLAGVAGTISVVGVAPALRAAHVTVASVGAFALAGPAASTTVARRMAVGVGSLVLSGSPAAFHSVRTISAQSATFSLSGTEAALAHLIPAPRGPYRVLDIHGRLQLSALPSPTRRAVWVGVDCALVMAWAAPLRLSHTAPALTLERVPSIDAKDRDMRKGFSEQIDVQCLAAGVAVDLTSWSQVKVQTSVDGATWVDRTTTIVTASEGKVRAILSTSETAALTANTTLRVRVSGIDGSSLTRCFPDDAALDIQLRVTT